MGTQPTLPLACTGSSRVRVLQLSVPSWWLPAARKDGGEPMGDTQQPPHTLQQGWDLVCPTVPWGCCSAVDAPGPLSSSVTPGRRHGVLQYPALRSSGMCPQCAQSPRGAMAPVGRGTSASSPARTCSSSPSSTSVSWTPPQTRPSTGGRSAWTRWVSPSHQAIPLWPQDSPWTWVPCPPAHHGGWQHSAPCRTRG